MYEFTFLYFSWTKSDEVADIMTSHIIFNILNIFESQKNGNSCITGGLGCFSSILLLIATTCVSVTKSCLTLCDPMDCSPQGSSVHGIFQVRMLEWVVISYSRGSSRPRDRTRVSCIVGRFFIIWATREASPTVHRNSVIIHTHTHTHTHIYVCIYFAKLFLVTVRKNWKPLANASIRTSWSQWGKTPVVPFHGPPRAVWGGDQGRRSRR